MNELIIICLMCFAFLGILVIFVPIYYMIYKLQGGEKSFWEFLWEI